MSEQQPPQQGARTLSTTSSELAGEIGKILEEGVKPNEVTEQEFIDTYLPIAALYHQQKEFDTGYWVGAAGSVNNGLTVTDGMGNTLFTTPPLISMASVRIESGLGRMIDAEQDAVKNNRDRNAVASQFLTTETVKLSAVDTSGAVIAWHALFAKYGYKMVEVEDGEVVSQDGTPEGTTEDVTTTTQPEARIDRSEGKDEFL